MFFGVWEVSLVENNTNNIAKINNETISTQNFLNYINQTRMDNEYIKENIDNKVIEKIVSSIVSIKLLDMEINDLNIMITDKTLANKIKNNEVFLDDKKQFFKN